MFTIIRMQKIGIAKSVGSASTTGSFVYPDAVQNKIIKFAAFKMLRNMQNAELYQAKREVESKTY